MHAALHDAEQRRVAVAVTLERVERSAAALRPAQRELHRLARRRMVGRIRRALVEHHHDVGAERVLHLDRALRRQLDQVAVHRRAELDALLVDLAQALQAPDLEAAGVREHRSLPVHERVQAAVRADHVDARPQQQMERVAEDDLRAQAFELLGRHRFDAAVRADGHERRRVDGAAAKRHPAAPRAAVRCEQRRTSCARLSASRTSHRRS